MAENTFLLNSNSRIFVAEEGAGCGDEYAYYACGKMGNLEQAGADLSPIYLPDRSRPGRNRQIAVIREQQEPWSSSIMGYKPANTPSLLHRLYSNRQIFDLQLHFGSCANLSDFGQYETALVFEDVDVNNYSADSLGALNSGETAPIMETINITAARVYELFAVELARVGSNVAPAGGQIVGVAHSYYNWETGREFGKNFYALQLPYSYTNNDAYDHLYILASVDGGLTWTRHELPGGFPNSGELINSFWMAAAGDHLVFCMNNNASGNGTVMSIPVTALNSEPVVSFNLLSTGVTITRLHEIGGRVYAATENGKVFWFNPQNLAVNLVEDDVLFSNQWNDIDGVDRDNLIVGGATGTLAHRKAGEGLRQVPVVTPDGTLSIDITAVAMKTLTDWMVGTDEGDVYCTRNAGLTWARSFSRGEGSVRSIRFPAKNRGYITLRNPGEIWVTSDGGAEWEQMNDDAASLTQYSVMHDLAVCPEEPTTFVAVGYTAANSTLHGLALEMTLVGIDGFILTGI
jgi:hypothetical protein